jgi:hypothetical protein
MDLNEFQSAWQNQEFNNELSAVEMERLFAEAKYRANKLENFFQFSIKYFLLLLIILVVFNIVLELINFGTVEMAFQMIKNMFPAMAYMAALYAIMKIIKYDKDVAGFVKTSILRNRLYYAVTAVLVIYRLISTRFDPGKFIEVTATNYTILSLTILAYLLCAVYLVYLYITIIRPVNSDLKRLKKIISNL